MSHPERSGDGLQLSVWSEGHENRIIEKETIDHSVLEKLKLVRHLAILATGSGTDQAAENISQGLLVHGGHLRERRIQCCEVARIGF